MTTRNARDTKGRFKKGWGLPQRPAASPKVPQAAPVAATTLAQRASFAPVPDTELPQLTAAFAAAMRTPQSRSERAAVASERAVFERRFGPIDWDA